MYQKVVRVVLCGLHHFEEGLIDAVFPFPLKESVIVIGERLKLSYYTVLGDPNHSMVFQNCLLSDRKLVKI